MDSIGTSHTSYVHGNSSRPAESGEISKKTSDSSKEPVITTVNPTKIGLEARLSRIKVSPISKYHISKTSTEPVSETLWNTLTKDSSKFFDLTHKQITSLLNHSDKSIRLQFIHICTGLNTVIPEKLEQLFYENKELFDAIYCEAIISNIGFEHCRLNYFPEIFKQHNPWIYNEIIKADPFNYFQFPEALRDEEVFFRSLVKHKNYSLIKYIQSPKRVMELMAYPGAEIYFFFISPDIRRDQQWLEEAITKNPLIGACKILDDHDLIINGVKDWLLVFPNPNITIHEKEQIISYIEQYLSLEKVESLFNVDINPISSLSENPFTVGMVFRSIIAQSPKPTDSGNTLIKESQELADNRQLEPIKDLPDEIKSQLINARSIQTSGRNIILSGPPDTVTIIKLNRQPDQYKDKENLFLECAITEKIRQSDELKLSSAIPEPLGIFNINVDDIPKEVLENLHDKPHIVDGHIKAYIYMAPATYCRYAHTSSESGQDVCIEGIKCALKDAALLLRHGLAYTSCLPAFHDTQHNCIWNAFCALFTNRAMGRSINDFLTQRKLPGTFVAWNGTATERPDYRHSGLSDWGDFEPVGKISSYFKDQTDIYESAKQNLAVANTLFNQILAAVLLYARANSENKDYHWQCENENERAAWFIDHILSCFLEGYFGEKQNIAHFIGISNKTYDTWLSRTATELLYWTANRDNAPHGFAKDIVNHEQLSDQLFSNTSISPKVTGVHSYNSYPQSMTNFNGEQNLGWHSQHFPLTGLTQLLTLFAGKIVQIKDNTD